MQKQTFYQKNKQGKMLVWSIEVLTGERGHGCIHIEAGQLGGKLIHTDTYVKEGTNIGKSNERNSFEQACFDAQTEINKKVKSGYVTDQSEAKDKGDSATIPKPAKGLVFHPTGRNKGLTLEKSGYDQKRLGVDDKLDGWRVRIVLDSHGATFYTSSGDRTLEFPQIERDLMEKWWAIGNGEPITLDGEIYRHELQVERDDKDRILRWYYEDNKSGFNATTSACAAGKNKTSQSQLTPTQRSLRDQMEFHLFDAVLNARFETRRNFIESFMGGSVVPVKCKILNILATKQQTIEDIDDLFEDALSRGYEGLIIRDLDAPYFHGKNKQFLKYKPLIDGEFTVTGFLKSITGETLGSLVCITKEGKVFNCDLKGDIGTDKFKQHIWDNQSNFLQLVTVEFLEYTPDGIPRNPKAKSFRPAEDISLR